MYSRFDFDTRDEAVHEARYDMPDPLDPDGPEDFPIVTTRRRLIRLALVAAETAMRLQREGSEHDPMAWMLAPRLLFNGRDAIEAAQELSHCTLAILLHGLGFGLDEDPTVIRGLLGEHVPTGTSPSRAGRRAVDPVAAGRDRTAYGV